MTFAENSAWAAACRRWDIADVASVAVDAQHRVLLAVRRLPDSVLVFSDEAELIQRWPRSVMNDVHGISTDPRGQVYLTDDHAHRVRVVDPDGQKIRDLGPRRQPSTTGYHEHTSPVRRAGGPFNGPTNATVDPLDGTVLVADGYGNARVHRYDPVSGDLIDSWGSPGREAGQFHLPHGIATLPDGTILVADRENSRIQLFDRKGEHIAEWASVNRPADVAVIAPGLVAVAELSVSPSPVVMPHRAPSPPPRPGTTARAALSLFAIDDAHRPVSTRRIESPGSPAMPLVSPHGLGQDHEGGLFVAELAAQVSRRDGLADAFRPALRHLSAAELRP